jgi:hypothetical protein
MDTPKMHFQRMPLKTVPLQEKMMLRVSAGQRCMALRDIKLRGGG